jgi:hypothetical protein
VSGLRDALAAKQVLTTHYDIPMKPRPFIDAIVERLNEARQEAYRAKMPGAMGTKAQREKRIRETDAKAAEVKAELDACFYRQEFRGLESDADMDALYNAYPATDEQLAKAKAENEKREKAGEEPEPLPDLDLDGFNCAYVAACAVDSDLTAEEWRAALWSKQWTRADRDALFSRVHQANTYEFKVGIPFD